MQIQEYIKNLPSFNSFLNDLSAGRLFHSIMLINPDQEFLYAYSKILAGFIVSEGNPSVETKNKIDKEIHPDLFVFGKDKPMDAQTVKDLLSTIYVAPYEGDKKVYIISNFDEIAPNPANKLLKTLEEPPLGVTFIMLVKNETRVLQTLLSRAQKFYLEGFSEEVLAEILKTRGVEDSEVLSMEAGGNLTEALKLSGSINAKGLINFVVDTFLNLKITTDLARFLTKTNEFSGKFNELVSLFARVASLAVHSRAGLEIRGNARFKNQIAEIARMWNYRALALVVDACVKASKMLDSYVGEANVIDQFLLKILEVRRKCRV